MPLTFPAEWKFGSDGVPVPPGLVGALMDLVSRIASGSEAPQRVVETFKTRFGVTSSSSSLDWAYSDLSSALDGSTENGALFAEATWLAVEDVGRMGVVVPTAQQINALFLKHGFPYSLDPPRLTRRGIDAVVEDRRRVAGAPVESAMPYTLGSKIGQGGFGTVYRASKSTSLTTFEFALKLLDPSPFISNREKAKARFAREVQAVQRLQHRGIVPYIDAGLDQHDRPYLVMPLIQGVDIRTAAMDQPLLHRAWLMVEVLDAVAHAHSLDVLHRDLKPSNILVRPSDNQPVIVDFGQSYLFDELDRQSLTTSAVGSAGYIPSEVLANPKVRSPLQDVFACGVITYELLASQRPDPGDYRSLNMVDGNLVPLDPILRQAIAPATSRFQSAAEFRDALRAALPASR